METYHPGVHVCPSCGNRMDSVTPTNKGAMPGDGDVGICIRCASPFFFVVREDSFSTRLPTPDEVSSLAKSREVTESCRIVRMMNKARQGQNN